MSISGSASAADGNALPGVKVCALVYDVVFGVREFAPASIGTCTSSAADGTWTLAGLSTWEEIAVTFEKAGFISMLRAIETDTADIAMAPGEINPLRVTQAPEVIGTALDTTKGSIVFSAGAASDVTVTAVGFDGHAEHATFWTRTACSLRA